MTGHIPASLQTQNTVAAYLKSKQLLHFAFARQNTGVSISWNNRKLDVCQMD